MDKIPVGILGATGAVGQKFLELLECHPWFKVVAVAASDRSIGKKIRELEIKPCKPGLPCQIVFSGLDSSVAGEIETDFAKSGCTVISNSRNHRMEKQVPLLIPEVNEDHLQLIKNQPFKGGAIITNPNCSATGISLALKPLADQFGIEKVHAVTLQALSGAGYPGVASLDIMDNAIPFIEGEEEKIQNEPLKILGTFRAGEIIPYPMEISAQCTRVAVTDGHLACLSVKLGKKAEAEELISAWRNFKGEPQLLNLPFSPKQPLIYLEDERHPQPKLHRLLDSGMAVSIGRLQRCSTMDWKFVILSHNTIRGAAGSAILNAELMLKKGYLRGLKAPF